MAASITSSLQALLDTEDPFDWSESLVINPCGSWYRSFQ